MNQERGQSKRNIKSQGVDEEEKIPIIASSRTSPDPRTMVIEMLDAIIAGFTVTSSHGAKNATL